jgi:hypothetical protein
MKQERIIRLQARIEAGEAAAEALPAVRRVFAELREEAYRELEGEGADMVFIRARLLVLRAVEERLQAMVNGGQAARLELSKG